jgi:hypothetical protein
VLERFKETNVNETKRSKVDETTPCSYLSEEYKKGILTINPNPNKPRFFTAALNEIPHEVRDSSPSVGGYSECGGLTDHVQQQLCSTLGDILCFQR